MTKFSFRLFGSDRNNRKFNNQKSIIDNFTAMCELPFGKSDSAETKSLKAVLKKCQIAIPQTNDPAEVNDYARYNIAILEVAKLALAKWELERNAKSSRYSAITNFKDVITNQQAAIRSQYREPFIIINSLPANLHLDYMRLKETPIKSVQSPAHVLS